MWHMHAIIFFIITFVFSQEQNLHEQKQTDFPFSRGKVKEYLYGLVFLVYTA